MEELPEPPIDRESRIAYYEQMEQDGLNMVRHARKRLGWLAMGGNPTAYADSVTGVLSQEANNAKQ